MKSFKNRQCTITYIGFQLIPLYFFGHINKFCMKFIYNFLFWIAFIRYVNVLDFSIELIKFIFNIFVAPVVFKKETFLLLRGAGTDRGVSQHPEVGETFLFQKELFATKETFRNDAHKILSVGDDLKRP